MQGAGKEAPERPLMPKPTLDAIIANRFTDAGRISPWTLERVTVPCDCRGIPSVALTGALAVAHLWDTHVKDRRDWTKARLLGWMRGVGGITKAEFTAADERWLNRFGATLVLHEHSPARLSRRVR